MADDRASSGSEQGDPSAVAAGPTVSFSFEDRVLQGAGHSSGSGGEAAPPASAGGKKKSQSGKKSINKGNNMTGGSTSTRKSQTASAKLDLDPAMASGSMGFATQSRMAKSVYDVDETATKKV